MARSPQSAGGRFSEEWMSKWMTVGSPTNRWDGFVKATSHDLGASRLWQTFAEASYFWKQGHQWKDFVQTLLGTTVGMTSDLTLGAPVAAWAQGKIWLVDHSL